VGLQKKHNDNDKPLSGSVASRLKPRLPNADSLLLMSKFAAIVITAAICLPLGAMLQRDAAAERRKNSLPGAVAEIRHGRFLVVNQGFIVAIDGHPHLALAQAALRQASDEITASQQAAEPMWSDQSRAGVTRDAIKNARDVVESTAAWISEGMARGGATR